VHEALTSQSSVPAAHSLTKAGVVGAGGAVGASVAGARVVRWPRFPLFFFFLLPPAEAELACESAIN
jgi:hypothetical protein